MAKNENQSQLSFGKSLLNVFIYAVIGLMICLCTAFVFSALIYFEKLSEMMLFPLSCVSAFIGTFFACMLSVKKFGKPLIISLIQGIVFLLILYIAGGIAFKRFLPSENVSILFLSCLSGALFNAVFSALFNKHRKN